MGRKCTFAPVASRLYSPTPCRVSGTYPRVDKSVDIEGMLSELFLDGRHGSTGRNDRRICVRRDRPTAWAPDREPTADLRAAISSPPESPSDTEAAPDALWQAALLALSSKVSAQNFDLWFRPDAAPRSTVR